VKQIPLVWDAAFPLWHAAAQERPSAHSGAGTDDPCHTPPLSVRGPSDATVRGPQKPRPEVTSHFLEPFFLLRIPIVCFQGLELKNMIIELASMQKKQQKERKEPRRSGGGTKIVVLPQGGGGGAQPKVHDDYMEKLRKSIFD